VVRFDRLLLVLVVVLVVVVVVSASFSFSFLLVPSRPLTVHHTTFNNT